MKRITILFLALWLSNTLFAQSADTITVMSYNVGQFGRTNGNSGCTLQNPTKKSPYLRTILRYTNPDIAGFVKMYDSPSFDTSTIIHTVFDSVCAGCYGHSRYTNKSGYNRNEILYFKTSKFGFISTTTLYYDANIHDINLHRLYYKSPSLAATHDTIFLNVILVHDASGSSSGADRATEIGGTMTALKALVKAPGNYIFMGDFNTQSSYETCYQDMIDSTNGNVRFYDAANQPGYWDASPSSFAKYLTETSRISDPGDCLANGGLADRFDHILCTAPLIDGLDSIAYINGTYNVLGNNGHITYKSINDTSNHSIPMAVLNAEYYLSEHLPVTARFAISRRYGSGISSLSIPALTVTYNSVVINTLRIQVLSNTTCNRCALDVYNLQGQLVKQLPYDISSMQEVPLNGLAQGMYIWRIRQNNIPVFTGRFVKVAQ